MSDLNQPALDACGCCDDAAPAHSTHENRPGLPALDYRIARYDGFLRRMLARIHAQTTPHLAPPVDPNTSLPRPLARLTTRSTEDPAIALLDAWAVTADVLTFYQERIANEHYLRTATERRSVLELARAIGYELKPGVAAETYLAFTVEDAPGAPGVASAPAGTQVQSIPPPNQLPQTFETSAALIAYAAWNALSPQTTERRPPRQGDTALYLAGTATNLRPGDMLLFVGAERVTDSASNRWDMRRVLEVTPDQAARRTLVTWDGGLWSSAPRTSAPADPAVTRVYALRTRASIFGHNAPDWASLPDEAKATYLGLSDPDDLTASDKLEWPSFTIFAPTAGLSYDTLSGVQYQIAATPEIVAAAARQAADSAAAVSARAAAGQVAQSAAAVAAVVGASNRVVNNLGIRVRDRLGEAFNTVTSSVGDIGADAFAGLSNLIEQLNAARAAAESAVASLDALNLPGALAAPTNPDGSARAPSALDIPAIFTTLQSLLDPTSGIATLRAGATGIAEAVSGIDISSNISNVTAMAGRIQETAGRLAETLDLGEIGGMAELGAALESFGATPTLATTAAAQALGATVVARLVDATVQAVMTAPIPPTVASVSDAATAAALAAEALVQYGPEAAAVTAFLANPLYGAPVAAAIGGIDLLLGDDASAGASQVRSYVGAAVEAARQPAIRAAADRYIRGGKSGNTIDLDREYQPVVPGSWLALATPAIQGLFQVTQVVETSRAEFNISAKITRLTLSGVGLADFTNHVRDTTVFGQSDELELAESPLDRPIAGDTIILNRLVAGLEVGRLAAITGKPLRAFVDTDGLTLTSVADPAHTVPLRRGDLLWTVAAPVAAAGGKQTWTLRTISGFVGAVTAATGAISAWPAEKDDLPVSEVRAIKEVVLTTTPPALDLTTIIFDTPLTGYYDALTTTINLNVVAANHGETVREILGSGDGAKVNQRFNLKKPPLTYTSAPTISGLAGSLIVRVDGVLWNETPSLYPLDARAESYVVRIEDDGKTTLTFGDGKRGARLPTGMENITATYRSGIGLIGEVAAGSLTLLKTRPQGVRAVTNPLAASGAEDPEQLDQARTNAPLTVLTLDRIVSLRDFEDFARAFPGIGKAQAIAVWSGETQLAHITVATASGKPLPPGDPLRANLVAAINAARDPAQPVIVATYVQRLFNLRARLLIDQRLLWDDVATAVRAALLEAFAFDRRGFGQQVTAAEVITIMQQTSGVVMVDLEALAGAPATSGLPAVLGADTARRDGATIRQAELLLINPAGIVLEEIAP